MAKGKTNSAREQRIEMEIIVDAHDSDERAMGGRFGEIFYSESEYHHTGVGPYAYGSSFDCQSCDFVHSIDQVEKRAKSSGKLVPTWA